MPAVRAVLGSRYGAILMTDLIYVSQLRARPRRHDSGETHCPRSLLRGDRRPPGVFSVAGGQTPWFPDQDEYWQPCPAARTFSNPDRRYARAACCSQGILTERDQQTLKRPRPNFRKGFLQPMQGKGHKKPPRPSEKATGDHGGLRNGRLCPPVMPWPSRPWL